MELNAYAIVILAALAVGFALDVAADALNLKNLKAPLPDEFKDVYDADDFAKSHFAKSQDYLRARTKFGFVSSIFNLAVLLAFWFAGGFNALDGIVRSALDSPELRGAAFAGAIMLAQLILGLPFSAYSKFVIEEKFGFNKTTLKTFALDFLKSAALGAAIGLPLVALVVWVFSAAGPLAWLYGWGAATIISLFLQYVFPTWIAPIFNKFEPLEDGDLRLEIMKFAEKAGFAIKNIFVMDGSKRSTKANAFFTGFGSNRRIVLFDTLIEKHTIKELVAVLAHEIGHFKKKHILANMAISAAHTGVLFYLLSIFLRHEGLFDAFYMDESSVYAGLIFFGLLYSPVELILSIFMNILSRKYEYQADDFAAEKYYPGALADALKKLSKNNLSNPAPHPFYVFVNYSHPPALARIKRLKEKAK